MKRIVSLVLTVLLVCLYSTSFATDFSSMTDAELREQFDTIRNELATRGFTAKKKTVILDQAGIQIYINGEITIDKEYSWTSTYNLYIPVVVVNNTDKNISIVLGNSSLNGWTVSISSSMSTIPAGKKAKGNLYYALDDTDIESISDFEDAEFSIVVYDRDNWFGDKVINQTEPIIIYADN